MKKRLVVLSTLVGLMLLVSFSVFGASDTISNQIIRSRTSSLINGNSIDYEIEYTVKIRNNSDKWATSDNLYIQLDITFGTLGNGGEVQYLYVDDLVNCTTQVSSGALSVSPQIRVYPIDSFLIAPYDVLTLAFKIRTRISYPFTVSFSESISNSVLWSFYDIDNYSYYTRSEMSLLDRIRTILEDISSKISSDTNVSSDLNNKSNAINNQESIIHQQESQWYQQNEQAINDVGLANFNFESGSLGGLAIMQQQFANIWNALGDLNLIYIFTLTISLSTFIIRHVPRTKQTEITTEYESGETIRRLITSRRIK